MMYSAKPITPELIDRFRKGYAEDPAARVLTSAASRTELAQIAFNSAAAARLTNAFSVEVRTT